MVIEGCGLFEGTGKWEGKEKNKGVGKFKVVTLSPINKEMADNGRIIFDNKCTLCHEISEKKITGPGLLGITHRRTPEWIMNMIDNPVKMVREDSDARALFDDYRTQMNSLELNEEEIRAILEYFRMNDDEMKSEK